MKYSICIWMNMPSHYQGHFFEKLNDVSNIDLKVIYYEQIPEDRKALGWGEQKEKKYELFVGENLDLALELLPDWQERIHIIPGNRTVFLKELVDILIEKKLKWVHWSERSGVNFAELINYNKIFYKFFYPIFLWYRGYLNYGGLVNKHALGAFSQGELAKKDFLKWGMKANKIENLLYTSNALECTKRNTSSGAKRSFIYVGTLEKRKGTDLLIKAFANLTNSSQWELILIGQDKSNGQYNQMINKLGLQDKIKLIGVVKSKDVVHYLCDSDVFVFPTRFDGWGVVINEATSLKKPIIATSEAGSAYHLLEDRKNGFFIQSNNGKSLNLAMQQYVDFPNLINIHGEYSYLLFQQYTPEENVKRFINAIKKWLKL